MDIFGVVNFMRYEWEAWKEVTAVASMFFFQLVVPQILTPPHRPPFKC